MYDTVNNRLVAVKRKVKSKKQESRETDQLTHLRKCANVTSVQDVFQTSHKDHKDAMIQNIVMEQMPFSLQGVMDSKAEASLLFSSFEIKCIHYQILNGLREMHQIGIAHRDIKPDNILVKMNDIDQDTDTRGKKSQEKCVPWVAKIADVGCAKALTPLPIVTESTTSCTKTFVSDISEAKKSSITPISSNQLQTPHCISLWYRPPELLAGVTDQSTQIDMWSAGCILFELQTLRSLFKAETEGELMAQMFEKLGTPQPSVLKKWQTANPRFFREVISRLPIMRAEGLHDEMEVAVGMAGLKPSEGMVAREELNLMLDLTYCLLDPDQEERYCAEQALRHPYFDSVRQLFPDVESQLCYYD